MVGKVWRNSVGSEIQPQAKEIAELINNKSDYVTEADTQLAMTLREFLFPDIPPGQLVSAKAVGKKLGRHAVGEPVMSGDQTLILRGARKRRRCLFGRFWMEMANSQKAHSQCVRGAASASYHLLASRKLYPPIRPNALDSRNRRLTVSATLNKMRYPLCRMCIRTTQRPQPRNDRITGPHADASAIRRGSAVVEKPMADQLPPWFS
jgi:hypothetical protein